MTKFIVRPSDGGITSSIEKIVGEMSITGLKTRRSVSSNGSISAGYLE